LYSKNAGLLFFLMNKKVRTYRIAIDGHSSSGKSTIAKSVAAILGYKYIDTGAMYRAITYKMLSGKISTDDIDAIKNLLNTTSIDFYVEENKNFIVLDGLNVESEIRNLKISEMVSEVSAIAEVRDFLVKKQKELGRGFGVVMDGRDIGTVVIPDADFKFFVTASLEIRALRRQTELEEKSKEKVNYDQILANLKKRDEIDSTRKHSPLKIAEDAIIIDTSHLTIEEQLKKIIDIIENKKGKQKK
jgi:CMP/dCMP kinase